MLTTKAGHKLCPTHGKAFLLVPEEHPSFTGACGHPECIGKMVSAMGNRNRFWKMKLNLFHSLQIFEDFVAFIYEELLIEAKKGKPTIINPVWFNFKIRKFAHRDLKKGYAVISRVPNHYRSEHQQGNVKGFVDDFHMAVIEREYEIFKETQNSRSSAENLLFTKEVNEYIEEYWGKEWVLFLYGEIDRLALSKLWKIGFPKIRRLEKLLYLNVVSEFCDADARKELMNSYGLDGMTPLKNIIVWPTVDASNNAKWGKGRQTRVDKSYWITLADAINLSKGLTGKDKKKLLKIKQMEKELEQLRNSIRGEEQHDEGFTNETEETT